MSDKSNIIALKSRSSASVTAVLLMGTFLVACTAPGSGLGVSRYEPTYLRVTDEQKFGEALRQRYLELATNAFDRGAVTRSDFYSLRALMAAEGKLAQPGQAAQGVSHGDELVAAGQRLSAALSSGARVGSPDLAARAQAAYDCWLVETGSDGDVQIAQACRYNALNALAQLESASTGARLAASGGPAQPETVSYVVEPGSESRVINAPGGYTIEIITEQVVAPVPHYQTTLPAQHTTTVAPAPVIQHIAEPQIISAPQYVETSPIVESVITTVEPQTIHTFDPGFEPLEPIVVESVSTGQEFVLAPLDKYQPAQVPFRAAPTIDLGPINTVPVFDTRPVKSMPAIEIVSLPTAGDDAVTALIKAAASAPGDFSVFFGFDSDEVTLEGEDVLIDAVEQIRLSGTRRVTLMGFTDSVGNARYNQLLAMRRAQSVRKFLQKKLGSTVQFEILPVGEFQAVREGGDGVKEALNRKVAIRLM